VSYSGGSVGIGTTNPYAGQLTVLVPDGGAANGAQITAIAGGTAQGQRAVYSFYPTFQGTSDNAPRRAADIVGGFDGCPWTCEYLSFNVGGGVNDAGNLTAERMRISGVGNVGIATTAPRRLLDVNGEIAVNNRLTLTQHMGVTSETWHLDNAGGLFRLFWQPNINQGGAVVLAATTAGHIGIGTTSPQYPLSVNGTVQAKEVIVNTGWSDYVFDADYHLPDLSEVSAYIKAHHHLPDIPSEAEVNENGISLGEMQSKLLAKIEELTVQMIRLDSENRDLRREMQNLKSTMRSTSATN